MFDYNKYRRMREIDDTARWIVGDLFRLMFWIEVKEPVDEDKNVNQLSNDLLHLNRLMVAYTQYGEKSDIDSVLDHLYVKSGWENYPMQAVSEQWTHKAKHVLEEFVKYINTSAFRDMGLYLLNNQEENNYLNNELREEYRSVIYQLLEHI